MKIAVHLHVFYTDLIPSIKEYLNNIHEAFDLYLSIPVIIDCNEDNILHSLSDIAHVKAIRIERTPNRGRDIAPMLCTFKKELKQYDVLLHLHTKKSPHDEDLEDWFPFILKHLLHPKYTQNILDLLSNNIGMIAPPDYTNDPSLDRWGKGNINIAQELINRSRLTIDLKKEYPVVDYPQGTMFWARIDFLKELLDIDFSYNEFPEEPIGIDGTIAHALERLFFIWGKESNQKIYKVYCSEDEYLLQQRFEKLSVKNTTMGIAKKKHLIIIRILAILAFLLLIANILLMCLVL